jgi:hypothetical protein
MFFRKSKGDQRRDTHDKLVLTISIPANPIIADLLDYYTQQRYAFCTTFYERPPPSTFRSFSPAEASAKWDAAPTLSACLALALRTVNTSAPSCFKWTSHSL